MARMPEGRYDPRHAVAVIGHGHDLRVFFSALALCCFNDYVARDLNFGLLSRHDAGRT
jgi:hypothetical protein